MPTRRPTVFTTVPGAAIALTAAMLVASCGGRLVKQYEYEEDIHLSLDGSAVVYVNASVPALVALRGLPLDTRPTARLDRNVVRELYQSPVTSVSRVSTSRRLGRRFVHVRVEVGDVRALGRAAPFAWSTYRFDRDAEMLSYRQVLSAPAGKAVGAVGWRGDEVVGIRLHVPSRIAFHNALPGNLLRGNILVWEQGLTARLAGQPVDLHVRMQRSSILARTLLLFAISGGAAFLMLGLLIWLVVRRGRRINSSGAH